jgi:hypothetical protein
MASVPLLNSYYPFIEFPKESLALRILQLKNDVENEHLKLPLDKGNLKMIFYVLGNNQLSISERQPAFLLVAFLAQKNMIFEIECLEKSFDEALLSKDSAIHLSIIKLIKILILCEVDLSDERLLDFNKYLEIIDSFSQKTQVIKLLAKKTCYFL